VKVSGLTIVKDALRLGYPFRESIRSLLPLVDELWVCVGQGSDGTWEAVQEIEGVRAFRSEWDLSPRQGAALSEQTNLALSRCSGDWAIYLQADEVLHEQDLEPLRRSLARHRGRDTEGLLFDYLHFFRHGDVVSDDWLAFYPRAVRAVKLGIGVESAGDAAGFVRRRAGSARGLIKARSGARVFHYGWCGDTSLRLERARALAGLYQAAEPSAAGLYPEQLASRRDLRLFRGSHPRAMKAWLQADSGGAPPRLRPARSPALLRAYASLLRSPRALLGPARSFLPLWLTNLRWRFSSWRERSHETPAN
jgi:hypothetical protein